MKFLGHMIDQTSVSMDPSKVESISKISSLDLMELDGTTPSQENKIVPGNGELLPALYSKLFCHSQASL